MILGYVVKLSRTSSPDRTASGVEAGKLSICLEEEFHIFICLINEKDGLCPSG